MKHCAIARRATLAALFALVFSTLLFSGQSFGQGFPLLSVGDLAIAIDEDGEISISNYPGAESPAKAIDGDPLAGDPPAPQRTKYLNFGDEGSGFIVTPLLGLPVESFQIRTANDAPARDPASWELYGFDGAVLSADNSTGMAETWTLIDSGGLSLPGDPTMNLDQRSVLGDPVDVDLTGVGGAGFTHYKMVFPTIKDPAISGILQIGEIQFYDADNAAGNPILTPGDPILAINERTAPNSRFPAAESPLQGIDQDSGTKYLNFGKDRSGIIITNSGGPVLVETLGLTTANDWPGRDPGSYELYGTNDAIQSAQHSTGEGGEAWTLISSGPLSLPGDPAISNDGRFMEVLVPVNATESFTSYKLVFPTLKAVNGPSVDSMQIADIQLYGVPEPTAFTLVMLGGLAAAAAMRRR